MTELERAQTTEDPRQLRTGKTIFSRMYGTLKSCQEMGIDVTKVEINNLLSEWKKHLTKPTTANNGLDELDCRLVEDICINLSTLLTDMDYMDIYDRITFFIKYLQKVESAYIDRYNQQVIEARKSYRNTDQPRVNMKPLLEAA